MEIVSLCLVPCGEKLLSFGKHGSGQGEFNCPRGVAVDGEGNILVSDGGNLRIQKLTAEGKFLAGGTGGREALQLAYNAKNRMVYVVEGWNHRVQILNSDLTFSSTLGKNDWV